MREERLEWMNNRQFKKNKRKQKRFFCSGCDASLVSQFSKCENCGKKNNKRKNKRGRN